MSDMTALLNDLSYIPLNNEHNKLTQGDIGETSNEPTQATRNEFEELYASANEELYPGCDYVTQLNFMAKFTYFKVKGKLTDSIFNEMLEFFQYVFPISKGYKLPSSYYAIKKTFKMIGLGYESIHACKHDCCLFRGDDNKDLDFYSVCNMSRWKDSNTLEMSADVSLSHGDDDGGEDPPSTPCTQWEVIRGVPLYYSSWLKVPKERKAMLITHIGTQFNLKPHMESPDWTEINAGIQQHLQKAYNTNKAAFKAQHWVIDPSTGTYNVEKIRRERPENITASE
nr:hypothetical protein [Tanacetum cinerariifolium]